jgi:predicted RNA-binding protein (virulence factor B family)
VCAYVPTQVLDALHASPDGSVPLGDKSDSEAVVARLAISKTQFKAAVVRTCLRGYMCMCGC